MEYPELQALEYQPFDSDIFRFPFYRLDPEKIDHVPEDFNFLRNTSHPQFGCDAKISTPEEELSSKVVSLGFKIVCQQTTLGLDTSQQSFMGDEFVKISERLSDSEISSHSRNFKHDRLSLDNRIPPEIVSRFYSKWIRNAFTINSKKVYVLGSGCCIVMQQNEQLKIDLVSVLEKRKGFGKRLLLKVLYNAKAQGQEIVQVTTESHNEGAIRLYEKCGFRPISTHHCFHFFNISD